MNNGKWKLGRVESQIKGKDGILRGFKIRTGNGYIVKHPVQVVADLEIGTQLQPQNTGLTQERQSFEHSSYLDEQQRLQQRTG